MKMERDRPDMTLVKRLTGDWRVIVKESWRGIQREPTVAAV